jgi:hypothetical protein
MNSGILNKKDKETKASEQYKIGRVETADGIGIVYDINDKKAGEVHGAGEDAKAYGGALLALIIDPDIYNAPYSEAHSKFDVPKPPIGSTYDDLSDTEKIVQAKREIHAKLCPKYNRPKTKTKMDTYEEQAEQASDKVAYWETLKKEITGTSTLSVLKTTKKKKTSRTSILPIIKKLLKLLGT